MGSGASSSSNISVPGTRRNSDAESVYSVCIMAHDKSPDEFSNELLSSADFFIPGSSLAPSDVAVAKSTWNIILDGESPEYLNRPRSNSLDNADPHKWFHVIFYRLANPIDASHPGAQVKLGDLKVVSVINMLTYILDYFEQGSDDEINVLVDRIVSVHFAMGVKSYQYIAVCKILLVALKECLGDTWTFDVSYVWMKLISILLEKLIPASLELELLDVCRSK